MVRRLLFGVTFGILSAGAHADLILSAPLSSVDLTTVPDFSRPNMPGGLAQTVEYATLGTNTAGTVTYTYVGAEAWFVNQFFTNTAGAGSAAFATPGATSGVNFVSCTAGCTTASVPVSPGNLAFSFMSPAGSVANGGNGMTEPNYAVWLLNPDTAYLFLNDGGNGGVGDYNDMIIKVSFADPDAVPEPHTLALVFAGLGVLAIMARRRTRK